MPILAAMGGRLPRRTPVLAKRAGAPDDAPLPYLPRLVKVARWLWVAGICLMCMIPFAIDAIWGLT